MNYLKYFPFYCISLLPLPILHLISSGCSFVIYHILGYRRKVVRENIEKSFPQKKLEDIIRIEKKFYQHFCDVFFESIKALTISKKSANKRFQVSNWELVYELHQEEKDIIMYGGHYGNWEWFSFLPLLNPYKVAAFYQQQSNGYFDQLMKLIRGRFGLYCIESKRGYKTLMELREQKILSFTYMFADQSPKANSSMHWTNFLNRETPFLIGTERITKKMGQTVIFPFTRKLKRGKYQVEFSILDVSKGQNIIDQYANFLENNIRQSPELWLWSHRRWKIIR